MWCELWAVGIEGADFTTEGGPLTITLSHTAPDSKPKSKLPVQLTIWTMPRSLTCNRLPTAFLIWAGGHEPGYIATRARKQREGECEKERERGKEREREREHVSQ